MPNVLHSQSGVPPLLALFALFAGAFLGGILGAIAALPLAAALRVPVIAVVAPAVRQWTGAMGDVEFGDPGVETQVPGSIHEGAPGPST